VGHVDDHGPAVQVEDVHPARVLAGVGPEAAQAIEYGFPG
jgi:hypothetical protein